MGTYRADPDRLAARIAKLAAVAAAKKRAQTECKRGHLLSGANLYVQPDGKRVCKECRKLTARRYRQNKKRG
jgi:hypothetical protein